MNFSVFTQLLAKLTLLPLANEAPSPSEAVHIRQLLEEKEEEYALINKTIADLSEQQANVRAAINVHHRSLCSLQHLPPEILSEIFLCWLELQPHGRPGCRTPLILSHVCAAWRSIAFGTPRLWTRPHLAFRSDRVTHEHYEILSEFLSRSNPHPISLYLATRHDSVQNAGGLLEAILPFADRIESLDLDVPHIAYPALHSSPEKPALFPLLESVDITAPDLPFPRSVDDHINVQARPIFNAAPRLRKIVLSDGSDDGDGPLFLRHFSMPWSQLTSLDAENVFPSANEAHEILHSCTSLERCSLDGIPTWRDGVGLVFLPPVTLPHLSDMTIAFEDRGSGATAFLFESLQLPALTSLDLTGPCGHDISEAVLYVPMLFNGVGGTLTHLRLMFLDLGSLGIIPILSTLLVLESLSCELCRVADSDIFFNALEYEGSASPVPLAPRLEKLEIAEYGKEGLDVTPEAVVQMVASRWWSDEEYAVRQPEVVRWKEISIGWDDEMPMEFKGRENEILNRCRREGLRVSIS